MEERLQAFETALSRLFPGGDLDATVRSLLHDQEGPPKPGSSKSSSRHSTPAKAEPDRAEPAPEALPQQADGFDWAENKITVGDLTDGMAALSIKPEGAGYFGQCVQLLCNTGLQVLTVYIRCIFQRCAASSAVEAWL